MVGDGDPKYDSIRGYGLCGWSAGGGDCGEGFGADWGEVVAVEAEGAVGSVDCCGGHLRGFFMGVCGGFLVEVGLPARLK